MRVSALSWLLCDELKLLGSQDERDPPLFVDFPVIVDPTELRGIK